MLDRAVLEKLKQLNLNPVLIKSICGYLMGRRLKVVVNGESSGIISVDSGVLQGSVLGPFLFLTLASLQAPRFLSTLMTGCCLKSSTQMLTT